MSYAYSSIALATTGVILALLFLGVGVLFWLGTWLYEYVQADRAERTYRCKDE